MPNLKHIGLFEGIGGFSYGAKQAGWETIAWCEWNPWCQKLLAHYHPNAKQHGDITTTDFTLYRGLVNVITAGFPCQPFSNAGSRKGTDDERHLWPETRRAIRECRPDWVVLENVAGLLSILQPDIISVERKTDSIPDLFGMDDRLELTRIQVQEKVIAAIISELEAEGYTLTPVAERHPRVALIPAASVGAPHRRDRIWIVAHANSR